MQATRFSPVLWSVCGGVLWWAAWPTSPLTWLAFIALVPLLWVDANTASTKRFFRFAYLHMAIWNAATTWWIYNASVVGAALAIVLNSVIMCAPFLAMRAVKKTFGAAAGYASFIPFWVTYEYIHHNWDLSWPWLTLGNVFAAKPQWVQWYELTGTTGGSVWILISNLLLFSCMAQYKRYGVLKKLVRPAIVLLFILLMPLLLSQFIFSARQARLTDIRNATRNVVVVQPDVDPYNEKFTAGTQESQIQNLISLSEQTLDSATSLVVWPETAIPVQVDEDSLQSDAYYQPVWQFLQRHPQVSLLTGIDSYRIWGAEKKTATSRRAKEGGFYYDAYNTAALLSHNNRTQVYHKAKLVPGVETLPSYLLWMNGLFESFGGTAGGYGHDTEPVVFADKQSYFLAAPIICYESVYGDYVAGYVRRGANLLTIITNDGWWGNTQGYRQHMAYARLRAIETRRWVARSANTGISCFIDPLGVVYEPQRWDTKAAIKMNIEPLQHLTFFVRHGDWLSRLLTVATVVFLLLLIIFKLRNRFASKPHVPSNSL